MTDSFLLKIFRHIELIKEQNKKTIFLATNNFNNWQSSLINFIKNEDLFIVSNEDQINNLLSTENLSFGAILVCCKDFSEYIKIKTKIAHLQKKGIIVVNVSGYATLPEKIKIEWAEQGVTYPGLFDLAGAYSSSLICPQKCYVEFGCFEGKTISYAYHILRPYGIKNIIAFDSFEGLVGTSENEKSVFFDGKYFASRESFEHNLLAANCDLSNIKIVQGDIRETANIIKEMSVSVVVANIDVDIYEPAKAALDSLTDRLVQGSLLLFDDFDAMGATNKAGERRALQEWLKENPSIEVEVFRSYAIFGRSFIVHKN